MNNALLYKHIISKEVKNVLNEEIQNFNSVDYEDDTDIIDHNDISKHVYSYFPKTKQQLQRLIKKRIIENPKEPYLLDINTSHITSMSNLFSRFELSENENIEILDLSTWNTSNVKNMTRMFYGCMSLKELDISCFDTSNVIETVEMFNQCESLTNLDLSKFNTSKVKEMTNMFAFCKLLTNFDISNFDTSNVTGMDGMFYGCDSLIKLDLSHFNTFNVKTFYSMFGWCRSLKILDISNFDVTNAKNMTAMFNHCESLKELDLSNFRLSDVNYISHMFGDCKSLKTINLSNFRCPNLTHMSYLFDGCDSLETVYASDNNIKKIFYDFKDKLNENSLNFDVIDYEDNDIIAQHTIKNMIYKYFPKNDEELSDLIEERIEENPKKPYLLDIDTSQIVYMSRLFFNEDEIEILDLSTWDTSNVTQMWNMFEGCTSLKKIILSNWDTSNVISMDNMFERCKSLESLDLSGWDTYNVTDMSCMFKECYLLEELNLSGWQTSDVTFIDGMFEECHSLKNVYTNDESIKREFNEFKKSLLNETINYNFDVADYSEDNTDIVSTQEITNITASQTDILINKVLSGNYNADEFEPKEITLWNHRINGKIIDDNATIASYIDRDLPYPYFVNRLVSVDKIKKIGDVEMKTVDDEGLMVYTNYNFNKRLINKIMKLRKGTGKIGIFTYTKISYFIGVIIDTDKNKIIIYSLPLAKKLGFTENNINKGLVIIDKNLRNLLKDVDFDHINGNLNEVDYIYIGCYEYKIENL